MGEIEGLERSTEERAGVGRLRLAEDVVFGVRARADGFEDEASGCLEAIGAFFREAGAGVLGNVGFTSSSSSVISASAGEKLIL